ncbi:Extracellular ligand-binding receptor [Beutenbergia cavernae DSM 12333]|uniref:Extracellular ligand-binding receptor n=1 Tax=Beutenbergia cavernae (strain ATCC BAA-8 / DSM 12333 / CCUG 43141 / JCM 11478 / NBRC 16432 / NCIMB 13614 / HKI 0122) TaxID=471853 RepID=C5BV71_BEUC1|nr:ABC transporter substrate-binding protein [Beutenbergia cavernae]ACQ80458.1 Extracellular ligand-binding receptor [Beutenbergia cavernae DSM 12333]
MSRSLRIVQTAAMAGAVALVLAACGGGGDGGGEETAGDGDGEGSAEALVVGTLLPQTGSLSQLGPPEIAGVDLAVEEINGAGGVLGADVSVEHTDSSDADNAAVATQSVQTLLGANVPVIIGAASSQVTLNVIDDVVGAEVVQISPANTATDLSGYSEFFFRTAPPDSVQGSALGNLILGDGHLNLGILVFNEAYGTGLRDVVQGVVEEGGGTVTYGTAGQEFSPTEQNYAAIVGEVLATNPDAITILAFTTQTPLIIAELVNAGWDMANTYFVDGNLTQFGTEFEPGTLEGAQGTLPGAFPTEDFQARLLEIDDGLTDFSYAAEAYDATMLAALAAVRGGGTDGPTIQENMAAVSGADGGTECTGFEECAGLLDDGEDIAYQAVSGAGPFNENNDPSSANIGIYLFDAENMYSFQRAEFGEVPTE